VLALYTATQRAETNCRTSIYTFVTNDQQDVVRIAAVSAHGPFPQPTLQFPEIRFHSTLYSDPLPKPNWPPN